MRAAVLITLCLALSVFGCCLAEQCHAAGRLAVSVIFSSDIEAYTQAWNGFRSYFDEQEVSLAVSTYNLKDQEPAMVCSEIEARGSDVVFTLGTQASRLARERIKNIPVIFCMVFNPGEFAGTNSTGVSMEIPIEARLQGIKKILPHAKNVAAVYSTETAEAYRQVFSKGSQLGLTIIGKQIDSERQLPDAIRELDYRMDCFLMLADSQLYSPASVKHLLLESLRQGFPVVGLSSHYTQAGALFSFDCDYGDLGRQAAEIASRITNGETPGAIPPLAPRKIRLSINMLAADRLGIEISSETAKRASEVFGR
ncbi:MAG: ABC transporter substrate-binding protein [Candidatus Eisenbacteria bacterium]|nr:ABC transporter substrate-binding protein [Candidatus Eisenbacteria bacterium]